MATDSMPGWRQKRRRVLLLTLLLSCLGGREAANVRVTATARRVLNTRSASALLSGVGHRLVDNYVDEIEFVSCAI